MNAIKQRWNQISPKQRRYIAIGAAVGLLVIILWYFASSGSSEARADSGQKVIENVLTDDDTRDVGIDALKVRLDHLSKENDELRREQERIKKEASNGQAPQQSENSRKIQKLEDKLERENKAREELAKRIKNRKVEDKGPAEGGKSKHAKKSRRSDTDRNGIYDRSGNDDEFDPNAVFDPTGTNVSAGSADQRSSRGKASDKAKSSKPAKIVTISEDVDEEDDSDNESDPHRSYLPAGSIITVTTMSGMDAPTGQAARRDPLPSLMRIKHEAILPNRFRQDIKECFLLASGYGDLSSERAYLRAETLSCVRQDGGVIEKKIQAFATGEDGKSGVRGRLVSKQGAIIAKSLMAGFLSGASKAFDVNPVPTINTTNSGEQQYQKVLTTNSLQGAAVSGTSDALDRIAKFYIDMAESMYPVIEINAGRKISFIVQSGVSLDAEK